MADIKNWSGKLDKEQPNKAELLASLSYLDHAGKMQHIKTLRDNLMKKALKDQVDKFAAEKRRATTLKELKPIVEKEQDHLRQIYKAAAQKIDYYPFDISMLLNAGKIAETCPEKLGEAFKDAETLVREGFESEIKVVKLLHSSTNVEVLLSNTKGRKEYHWRRSLLPGLNNAISRAETTKEALKAIEVKEEFLSSLHGNLKHSSFDKTFTEAVATAWQQRQEGIVFKLKEAVETHLKEGITNDKDLLQQLQKASDYKEAYSTLDKSIESNRINKSLDNFSKELEQAKTPQQVIEALVKKDLYLSSLQEEGNLKYLDQALSLLQEVETAGTKNTLLQDLYGAAAYVSKQGVISAEELLKKLKSSAGLKSAYESLVKTCQDHHISRVESNMNKIREGELLQIGGKKFDSPIEYLEYEIAHPAHKYVSTQRLNKLQQQLQKQLELNHQMQGPRM